MGEKMDPSFANFIDSISGKEAAVLLEALLDELGKGDIPSPQD